MLAPYKQILISLFSKVQELRAAPLNKRLLALDIQEELLLRIGTSERIIKKKKKSISSLKSRLRTPGNSKQVSSRIKKSLERLNSNIVRQKNLMWYLRSIGDAIAFIYADKWEIKNYALKESPGFISGKEGTRLERGLLRRGFKLGATLVLNDLTNSLRHADLTLFRPDLWPEGKSPMVFFEAKSGHGGNKERAERQKINIEHINKYILTDTKVAENTVWHRFEAKQKSEHHFQAVENLIQRLPQEGKIMQEVEPGLYYALIKVGLPDFDPSDLFKPIFDKTRNVLMLSVNELKHKCYGYYPFTLCLIEPDSLYRFYNGEFLFIIFVDIDSVNKRITDNQLEIQLTGDESYPMHVVSKTPINNFDGSYIGFHIIGRLAAEFMRLDWFIENIILMENTLKDRFLNDS